MRRPAVLLALVSTIVLASPLEASAHPLGNFTVNRFAGLVLSSGEVLVHYVLDLAEIPAFQEMRLIDVDGDGAEEAELREWSADRAATIVRGLSLEVDRRALSLDVRDASAWMLPGQGGLATVRLEATFEAPLPSRSGWLTFEDRNDPGSLGWREITATGTEGMTLVGSSVPERSVSGRLNSYPEDLLSSPPSVTSMETLFRRAPDGGTEAAALPAIRRPGSPGGTLGSLIGVRGGPLLALGLIVALALGAWHALLPGHGKTLMAAAMVGSSARTRQAVVAGVSVALMHTASVTALGLAVLGLERAFRPEAVYPWIGAAAGLAAAAIGIHLVRGRLRAWRSARHEASEEGDRPHEHDHEDRHGVPVGGLLSPRGIAALALAGGILPAPSALIVMLAAIQEQRTAYGLALVLSFSAGLALSLVLVGLGAMRIRMAMRGRVSERLQHLVPLLSATAIVVVGICMLGRSAASI